MKCPMCGDEVVNGRCQFCGYVPTKEDMDAFAKWEHQKAEIRSDANPVITAPRRSKSPFATSKKPKVVTVKTYEKVKKPPKNANEAKFFEPEPAPAATRKPVKEKKALSIMKIIILFYVFGFIASFIGAIVRMLAFLG